MFFKLDTLEATFQRANYPDIRTVDDLSDMLNLSTERISIWFQNRRARFKKAKKAVAKENRADMIKTEFVLPDASSYQPSYSISNYASSQPSSNNSTTTATTNSYSSYQPSVANDCKASPSSLAANSYMPSTGHNMQTPAFYSSQFYQ